MNPKSRDKSVCEVIFDILTSPQSTSDSARTMIDDHVAGCESCRQLATQIFPGVSALNELRVRELGIDSGRGWTDSAMSGEEQGELVRQIAILAAADEQLGDRRSEKECGRLTPSTIATANSRETDRRGIAQSLIAAALLILLLANLAIFPDGLESTSRQRVQAGQLVSPAIAIPLLRERTIQVTCWPPATHCEGPYAMKDARMVENGDGVERKKKEACNQCHQDVHAKSSSSLGWTSCGSCHRIADSIVPSHGVGKRASEWCCSQCHVAPRVNSPAPEEADRAMLAACMACHQL